MQRPGVAGDRHTRRGVEVRGARGTGFSYGAVIVRDRVLTVSFRCGA